MHFIDNITINQICFKTTTHDRCIYIKIIDGELIYLLRMVDDCIISCKNEKTSRNIFNIIGEKMKFQSEKEKGIIPFKFLEFVNNYNGFDIKQTSHYIEMFFQNYILCLCKSHCVKLNKDLNKVQPINEQFSMGYESKRIVPIPSDSIEQMYKESSPKKNTTYHKLLEEKTGFSHCTLLGEVMYAYITCRPDIGYAVTTLSKFSCAPSLSRIINY